MDRRDHFGRRPRIKNYFFGAPLLAYGWINFGREWNAAFERVKKR